MEKRRPRVLDDDEDDDDDDDDDEEQTVVLLAATWRTAEDRFGPVLLPTTTESGVVRTARAMLVSVVSVVFLIRVRIYVCTMRMVPSAFVWTIFSTASPFGDWPVSCVDTWMWPRQYVFIHEFVVPRTNP